MVIPQICVNISKLIREKGIHATKEKEEEASVSVRNYFLIFYPPSSSSSSSSSSCDSFYYYYTVSSISNCNQSVWCCPSLAVVVLLSNLIVNVFR